MICYILYYLIFLIELLYLNMLYILIEANGIVYSTPYSIFYSSMSQYIIIGYV